MGRVGTTSAAVLLAVLCAGCTSATADRDAPTAKRVIAKAAPATRKPAPPPTARPTEAPRTQAPAVVRSVTEQRWTPFAEVGEITLTHPSRRVERVAFHESNHDGARQLDAAITAVNVTLLESRDRQTKSRTAADIVIDPAVEVRAPVTGTVKRAGSYTLYCDNTDQFVVIAPDAHPGWEVKVLHIEGLAVRIGQRVVGRETVLAAKPRRLPFTSQVDELTNDPWPHVHVEVVDPSIPDRPTPGGGCD